MSLGGHIGGGALYSPNVTVGTVDNVGAIGLTGAGAGALGGEASSCGEMLLHAVGVTVGGAVLPVALGRLVPTVLRGGSALLEALGGICITKPRPGGGAVL